jgi:hypothetical protein
MVKTGFTAKVQSPTLGASKRPRSIGRAKQADDEERSREDFQATILRLDAATLSQLLRQVQE